MLSPKQKKIDINNNDKLDADDFAKLREEKKEMYKGGRVGMGCAEGGKVMNYKDAS
jgi:hypothetical protein